MLKPEQVSDEMVNAASIELLHSGHLGDDAITRKMIAAAINASGCVLVKLDKEKLRRASVLASDSQYEFVAGKDDAVTSYLDSLAAGTPASASLISERIPVGGHRPHPVAGVLKEPPKKP